MSKKPSKHHDPNPAYLSRKYTPEDVNEIQRMVRNIITLTEQATAEELTAGADWYKQANKDARALAKLYNLTTETAAAIIAATSPGMDWQYNVEAAEHVIQHARGTRAFEDIRMTYTGAAPTKHALAILTQNATLTGPKRRDFCESIITSGKTHAVCVDGHAYNAANNGSWRVSIQKTPKLHAKRYQLTAQAYATAAAALGYEHPATLQAVVWTTYRNRTNPKPTPQP